MQQGGGDVGPDWQAIQGAVQELNHHLPVVIQHDLLQEPGHTIPDPSDSSRHLRNRNLRVTALESGVCEVRLAATGSEINVSSGIGVPMEMQELVETMSSI